MTNRQQHSIRKITLQLDVQGQQESVFLLQNELKTMIKDQAETEWNDLFSQVVDSQKTLRIPTLEIDLGRVNKHSFKKILLKQLEKKMQDVLVQKAKIQQFGHQPQLASNPLSSVANLIGNSKKETDLFLYFLEKGTFPWWAKKMNWDAWQQALVQQLLSSNTGFPLNKTKELLIHNQSCCDRLCWQFSETFLTAFLSLLEKELSDITKKILKNDPLIPYPSKQKTVVNKQRLANVLYAIRTERQLVSTLENTAREQQHIKEKENRIVVVNTNKRLGLDLKSASRQTMTRVTKEAHLSEDYHYINNAGLVIILPFAAHIFEEMGYLKPDRLFKTPKKQVKAIHLLQYLACGVKEYHEHELLFNKLVCGWKLDEAIPKKSNLTKHEKQQADDFLKEIIEQWGAVKNMSPEGLRCNFLTRNGKLSFTKNHWLLQIESMAFDPFLLNKLPWTISIIKNKWMTKRIHVEWNN